MSSEKGGPARPANKDRVAATQVDTTIVQKVLGKGALALESTAERLRRMQRQSEPRPPQSPPPAVPGARPGSANPPPRAAGPPADPHRPGPSAGTAMAPRPPASGARSSWPTGDRAQARAGAATGEPDGPSGKIQHDSRGNAVWNWAVSASAHALESTSRLLKRLEAPELQIDEKPPSELSIEDSDPGGGYDPYSKGGKGLPRGKR